MNVLELCFVFQNPNDRIVDREYVKCIKAKYSKYGSSCL